MIRKPEPIKRVLERSPLIRRTAQKVATAVQWMKVLMRSNTGKRQVCQIRNGPYWYDNAIVVEPQGFTAGIEPGCVGVMVKLGGMAEEVALISPSRAEDRPTYVEKRAVCMFTPYQSRLFMDELGNVELGSGLSDYKGTRESLDEGAKVRLLEDGTIEVYSETEVRLRAQPQGGEGPAAVIVLRPSGVLEVTTDADVSVVAGGSVSVEAAGSVTLTTEAELELRNGQGARVRLAGADVMVEPGQGGLVQLGGVGGKWLAHAEGITQQLQRLENALNGHAHAAHGTAPSPNPAIQMPLVNTSEAQIRVGKSRST